MVKRIWMAVALAVATQIPAAPEPPPVATITDNVLRIALPDWVLQRAAVRKQLSSALTTTFVIRARSPEMAEDMRARMEVRFDLWDDAYRVRRIELGRPGEEQQLSSFKELEQWWRTPIRLGTVSAAPSAVDLQLTVLPFSAADEGDARDWLSKSGGVGTDESPVKGVVGAMIGTTIQARPIAQFRWTIQATAERR